METGVGSSCAHSAENSLPSPSRKIQLILIPLIAFCIAGCTVVGKASTNLDEEVKNLAPPSDKALVYIVRPAKLGKKVKLEVAANGQYVGATAGNRYLYTILDAGRVNFSSEAENRSDLLIELEAGEKYFIEQQVKMGIIKARTHLVRVPDQVGQDYLNRCALSSENAFSGE